MMLTFRVTYIILRWDPIRCVRVLHTRQKKGEYYLETKKQPRVRACVNKYYVKTFKLDDKREKITRIGRRSSSYSADQIPRFRWARMFENEYSRIDDDMFLQSATETVFVCGVPASII